MKNALLIIFISILLLLQETENDDDDDDEEEEEEENSFTFNSKGKGKWMLQMPASERILNDFRCVSQHLIVERGSDKTRTTTTTLFRCETKWSEVK